jgi:hypothetical protein
MDYDVRINKIIDANKDEFKTVTSLLNALRKELDKFDYDGDYRKLSHFLIKINEIVPRLGDRKQKIINAEIVRLHKQVKDIIKNRPNYLKKENPNFGELRNIIGNLEGMNISYMYSYVEKYDGDAYNLIKYLIFEEKNLVFVKYAFDKYPHLVNVRDKNGNCILLEVVAKYLKAINKYTRDGFLKFNDDLFYYDEVLENLLNSSKIDYSSDLKAAALSKVELFLNRVNSNFYSGEVKKKLIFWVNELIEKLEENSYDETLSHLSYKTDVSIDFHESVLSEARRFNVRNLKSEFEKRIGNQDEYIVTIDGEGAEEIDDGLSVKKLENGNYLLGVHISDPSGYISKNSLLYEEANRRTTSIYSPLERTSSMFPESYAKDHMSLTQGKNRLATSYYLEITPYGEILLDRCVFKKTIVNVNKKLTYDEFNILSKSGSDNKRLDETVEMLLEVTDLLSKRIIMDENYRIAKREASNVSGTNIIGSSSSEKLVEYAMLAANSTVASYAANKGIPFIYRGHEMSKDYLAKIEYFDKKFRENPTSENYEVFVKLLRNTYPSAFYTTDSKIKHMGIGVEHYSHITSPLRRFADCLANEALNLMYFGQVKDDCEVYELENRLKEGCRYINEKKTSIDYFTDRYVKVKSKIIDKK